VKETIKILPNPNRTFKRNSGPIDNLKDRWLKGNTAVLVIHGIGNQNPLETLDSFGRGLITTYKEAGVELCLEHMLAKKEDRRKKTFWSDNYLHLTNHNQSKPFLDIYEYYWAAETENQATLSDLNKWLSNTTSGARKFYEQNVELAETSDDESIFIKNHKFRPTVYWICVNLLPSILVFLNWGLNWVFKLISSLPIVGSIVSSLAKGWGEGALEKLSNILNDISIYNTIDAKSKFFKIRNCILDGSVDALKYLLEASRNMENETLSFKYDRVLIAGHSLGSQIAFDTINRINHLTNQGELLGYDSKGNCNVKNLTSNAISIKLTGLVTFGSPLDKIAFFLREQVPETEYIRAQILTGFHGFKQRNWLSLPRNVTEAKLIVKTSNQRLFDDIPWYNYWDAKDFVSGPLDYYKNVVNIDCKFNKKSAIFTHNLYWDCKKMYEEIIEEFLMQAAPEESISVLNGV
jgi:hypothetical protein